jgi:hypothetical protein
VSQRKVNEKSPGALRALLYTITIAHRVNFQSFVVSN